LKLDIVIPAYNEEGAIQAILQRCLGARSDIIEQTQLTEVMVTVVSDGSSDRTESLARSFEPEARVLAFPQNQGYGAALKAGFAAGDGELVGFLDADGTCDPRFFIDLVNNLVEQNASVSIGSRMTPRTRMPLIRQVGNRIWRMIINWIAQTDITDAASGMRVMRRDALPLLDPLPDGLHYTPTMTCRAALDARLSIVEKPMDYEERVGRSKLSVVKDGLRFLRTILDVGITYQPFRLIALPGLCFILLGLLLIFPVATTYLRHGIVLESEIYRTLAALVAAVGGFQMFLVGLLSERVVSLTHPKKWQGGWLLRLLNPMLGFRRLLAGALALFIVAVWINREGLRTYMGSGQVFQHWSRTALGAILVLLALQCLATALLMRLFQLLPPRKAA
jgi:glycosyltransferase involved in cell wall biosynthesis